MTKKPRFLEPLEMPAEDKKLMLEVRGDSRTIVDWVSGHAKLKTKESIVASVQNLLRVNGEAMEWIYDNVRLLGRFTSQQRSRFTGWEGVKGREEEWVDTVNVVWSEVPVCVVSRTVAAKTVRVVLG